MSASLSLPDTPVPTLHITRPQAARTRPADGPLEVERYPADTQVRTVGVVGASEKGCAVSVRREQRQRAMKGADQKTQMVALTLSNFFWKKQKCLRNAQPRFRHGHSRPCVSTGQHTHSLTDKR